MKRAAIDAAGAECHRLPGEVGRRLRLGAGRHEGAAPGPWLEHALGRERGDRALHGDRRRTMAGHEIAHRGQALAGQARLRGRPQVLGDATLCVIVWHEPYG